MLRPESVQISFYGNHIYDWVIPECHFLKLLDKAVDFSFVDELRRDAYISVDPHTGQRSYSRSTSSSSPTMCLTVA
jgi:hypothetical protein